MRNRSKSLNALKHGAYSDTVVLPGESIDEFEKLHRDFVDEFAPNGPLEEDIVWSIARLVWRKHNLKTYRIAAAARCRISALESKLVPHTMPMESPFETREPTERERAAIEEELREARKELGAFIGAQEATTEFLFEWLTIEERLDSQIDRCLKRLLMVRGVKSMNIKPPGAAHN